MLQVQVKNLQYICIILRGKELSPIPSFTSFWSIPCPRMSQSYCSFASFSWKLINYTPERNKCNNKHRQTSSESQIWGVTFPSVPYRTPWVLTLSQRGNEQQEVVTLRYHQSSCLKSGVAASFQVEHLVLLWKVKPGGFLLRVRHVEILY